jgi:hypothetical protein
MYLNTGHDAGADPDWDFNEKIWKGHKKPQVALHVDYEAQGDQSR